MSTLKEYIALLETADSQINKDGALALVRATDDLLVHAQSIAHVVSGHMRDTMHRLGPFPIGGGALETTIESGAFYAEEEVAKGGEHDWATRTIQEQAARIQQLADEVEGALVRALVGGSA